MWWKEKIQWQSVTNGLRKEHVLRPPFLDKVLHHFFFLMVICNSLLLSDFIFYQKPLYKSLHQSFFYSFITILPSESGATLHYSTILPWILWFRPEEKISFLISSPLFLNFIIGQNRLKFKVHKKSRNIC
jgi:hypothetical protein